MNWQILLIIFFCSVSSDLEPLRDENLPYSPSRELNLDQFIIEPYQVEKKLAAVNPHKSAGPDDIPNWIWHEFAPWLAEPICAIFNASIRQGVVPPSWKRANVVPIPKINPPVDLRADLRPISLTPTLSKLLESFIGHWLLTEVYDKIDVKQFGALKGKSTTHELVDLLHHWHEALDKHASVRALFVDYAKAFDHIDHIIVIQKLNDLKVSQVLVQWISSFLTDRQQRVKISDVYSNWMTLRGGMPEGSFLGPLIFLIMINDLTAQGLLYKFLDDVTLSETVVQGTRSCFNSSIEKIIVWSKLNHMNINWNKTKEMILGSVKDLIAQPLRVEDHDIQRVDSFKLLGLIIDSNLRWSKHVEFICSKASQRLHYLKILKRSGLSIDDLLYFYCTVIRTILEYACPAWHTNLTLEDTSCLEDVQKRALSIIFGLGDYDDLCERAQLTT